jgi:hypothetical protein
MRSLMIALIFLLMTMTGCQNSSGGSADNGTGGAFDGNGNGDGSTPVPPANMKIDLPEVTGTCLNLEKYFQRLRSLPTTVSARKLTKDMSFKATGNNIPRNFLLRLAAGNFQMNDATLAEVTEFVEVKQEACTKVIMRIEGRDEPYKITRAKPDSLTLENEWANQITVTWKAVNKLQFESISTVGDFLCDPNSRGRLQTIMEITWGNPDIFTEAIPEGTVDRDYLKLVVEATAYPATIYSETNALVANRLKELHSWPVRADLLQCY